MKEQFDAGKHYAEVLIDGKIYTLGGAEEEHYLQRVASYISEKISQMKRQEGFSRQSQEYQAVMVELNIADDYFKASEQARASQKRCDEMEKETYSLKHELVGTQMKLEAVLKDLEERQRELEQLQKKAASLEAEREKLRAEAEARQAEAERLRAEAEKRQAEADKKPAEQVSGFGQAKQEAAAANEALVRRALAAAEKAGGHRDGRR